MGNTITKDMTVNIENLPEFRDEVYTVKRTSGILESGWILKRSAAHGSMQWPNKSAYFDVKENKWRIYTQNGKENPNEWLHAWRDLEKVFPSSLEGKEEEIEAWRKKVCIQLEILEKERYIDTAKTVSDMTKSAKTDV